jgi:hypothetical protein
MRLAELVFTYEINNNAPYVTKQLCSMITSNATSTTTTKQKKKRKKRKSFVLCSDETRNY